jgi:ribosomal protein S27E
VKRPSVTSIQVDTDDEPVTFAVSQVALTCEQCRTAIPIPEGMSQTALALIAQTHADTHRH